MLSTIHNLLFQRTERSLNSRDGEYARMTVSIVLRLYSKIDCFVLRGVFKKKINILHYLLLCIVFKKLSTTALEFLAFFLNC